MYFNCMQDLILTHPIIYPSRNVTDNMSRGRTVNGVFKKGSYERNKEKWQHDAWLNFMSQMRKQGHLGFTCPVEVRILLQFAAHRHRDYDNYAPKWLMDVLKYCKAIPDDNSDVCNLHQVEFINGDEDMITVRITEHEKSGPGTETAHL